MQPLKSHTSAFIRETQCSSGLSTAVVHVIKVRACVHLQPAAVRVCGAYRMCVLDLGFNCFSTSAVVWKSYLESISVLIVVRKLHLQIWLRWILLEELMLY